MKKIITASLLGLFSVSGAFASEKFASKEEAQAIVKKAVAAIKESKDKTFAEITAKDAKWVNGDLYPVVYSKEGVCLSHGQNEKQPGKDLIALKDADGKEFVKERVELAKTKKSFTQDYKFKDPVTSKVLVKEAYCEVSDVIVCAGVYKR